MSVQNYERLNCPVAKTLSVVGDQWTLLIIRDLLAGKGRFNEIQDSLGLSRNLLAQRLRQLVEEGLAERVSEDGSARARYQPTQKCRELRIALLALAEWGDRWHPDGQGPRLLPVDRERGEPVGARLCRLSDGALLELDQVRVRSRSQAAAEQAAAKARAVETDATAS